MENNNQQEPSKDLQERLDPDLELYNNIQLFQTVLESDTEWNMLQSLAGGSLDREKLRAEFKYLPSQYSEIIQTMEDVSKYLSPLGWINFAEANQKDYQHAANLVKEGKQLEAEDYLMNQWNQNLLIKMSRYRVFGLYAGTIKSEVGELRARLIDKAFDMHQEENYIGSIPVVLAQIEGIIIDMTDDNSKLFYSPKKSDHLEDNVTIAGHKDGLKALSKLMGAHVRKTEASGKLIRNGIMHGKELGYDTKLNSTKTFVALLAVMEFAKPLAAKLKENL